MNDLIKRNSGISVREACLFFDCASIVFLKGSKDSPIPVNINGTELNIVFFPFESNLVGFGLFLKDKRYSRKTFFIAEDGSFAEDRIGKIPDFDKADNEPDFGNISNSEIINLVWKAVKEHL